MNDYLVISAILDDEPGLVERISRIILENNANINDSRMSVLGNTFALIMLINGDPKKLDTIEEALHTLRSDKDITLTTKRTNYHPEKAQGIPYIISAVTLDSPGIIHAISNFLSKQNINILNLSSDMEPAAHSGTPIFAVSITADIPLSTKISQFKDDFYDLCDEMNIDGNIKPEKTV